MRIHYVVQKVTHITLNGEENNVSQGVTKGYYRDIAKCGKKSFPFSVSAVPWVFYKVYLIHDKLACEAGAEHQNFVYGIRAVAV